MSFIPEHNEEETPNFQYCGLKGDQTMFSYPRDYSYSSFSCQPLLLHNSSIWIPQSPTSPFLFISLRKTNFSFTEKIQLGFLHMSPCLDNSSFLFLRGHDWCKGTWNRDAFSFLGWAVGGKVIRWIFIWKRAGGRTGELYRKAEAKKEA